MAYPGGRPGGDEALSLGRKLGLRRSQQPMCELCGLNAHPPKCLEWTEMTLERVKGRDEEARLRLDSGVELKEFSERDRVYRDTDITVVKDREARRKLQERRSRIHAAITREAEEEQKGDASASIEVSLSVGEGERKVLRKSSSREGIQL
ncbi:uncharacterized protein BDR25DRAFT_366576 [Lindgomyces ingoldianus]|uniref:Uncharacterized protein n=1 Tax=Lindgomyces ingoldianus TaxID=673940 RepID=A0ACB6R0N6_9PLEO|nr:uncharacterized protein BDR25DRAFT_366576 [Lindgomyces ingoldianus]KAF2472592.1 hypothetical protein BDR25DRAFT_366576 [Lindgomyces ingoldianus]